MSANQLPILSHYPSWPAPVNVRLTELPERTCPYLPPRLARSRAFLAREIPPELYHSFMDAGFRRSGTLIYQPVCNGCRECKPIRIPVARFEPGKSHRRCLRRNADLSIHAEESAATDEKYELYRRYVTSWHAGEQEATRAGFEQFLCDSPVETFDLTYRDPFGRLLAVGVCDISPQSISSVYFYFDPADAKRGLGTFGALKEIEFARSVDIAYYYLGYWISGCGTMDYKRHYRPSEVLGTDGVWRELDAEREVTTQTRVRETTGHEAAD